MNASQAGFASRTVTYAAKVAASSRRGQSEHDTAIIRKREDPGRATRSGVSLVDLVALGPRDRATPASATRLRKRHPFTGPPPPSSRIDYPLDHLLSGVSRSAGPNPPDPGKPPRLRGRRVAPRTGTRGPWPNITADSKHVSPFFSPAAHFFSACGPESRVLQGPVSRPDAFPRISAPA